MEKEKFKNLKVSGTVVFCLFDDDKGEYRLTVKGNEEDFKEIKKFEDENDVELIHFDEDKMYSYVNVKSGYKPEILLKVENKGIKTDKINDNCDVIIKVKPYAWEYKRKKGISLGLQAVLITEYKESSYNNAEFFNLDEIDKSDALPF